MPAASIQIKGRVQGVGFRYFVEQTANSYGVMGEVWNSRDGCVYVHAEHPDAQVLEEFVRAMYTGPGHVSAVNRHEVDGINAEAFRISETR